MKFLLSPLAFLVLAATSVLAQSTSTSASYALLQSPVGSAAGGIPLSGGGGTILAEASVGHSFGGSVTDLSPGGVQLKNNYIGQLYDVVAIEVSATPDTIDEGGTRQLTTAVALDDATFLALPPSAFSWNYSPGVASIDSSTGLATAEPVYEDMTSTAAAAYAGVESPSLSLTILDTDEDNYLSYGNDTIDDHWQVAYFGTPPNAEADPAFDKDGDGDDNTKEFLFGFSPLDASDALRVTVLGYSGPHTVDLQFNRVIPGRTYTLLAGHDLESYDPTGSAFSVPTTQTDYLVQDTGATGDPTFYQIEVSRP